MVATCLSSHTGFPSCWFLFSFSFFPNHLTQTAQNGSGGGQSIDTAVYQQGAAVTYNQEGHEYSGPDGTSFKTQTDARVPALPGAGTALMGAYTGGAAPGWCQICYLHRAYHPCDLIWLIVAGGYLFAAAISSEAVTSGSAVVQQPLAHAQAALMTTAAALPATQVQL